MTADHRRRVKRLIVYISAWVMLSSIGSVLHWAAWIGPREVPPVEVFFSRGVWRQVGNLFAVPSAPGWIVTTTMFQQLMGHDLGVTIISNSLAWAMWLSLLALLLSLRKRWTGRRSVDDNAPPQNLSRRRLLVDGAFAAGAFTVGGAYAKGTIVDPWQCQLVRFKVPIRGLPQELSGLRMVQISDTHLGPRVPAEYIRGVLARAIAVDPDIFLLTGDYIHNGRRQVEPAVELFAPVIATGKPVVAVLGNHDWYDNAGPISKKLLAEAGVTLIENSRVFMDAATRRVQRELPSGPSLCFAGFEDLLQGAPNPGAALDGVPADVPRIVLSHNPDMAEHEEVCSAAIGREVIKGRRIDLMLSGHTHGGQVSIPFIGPPIVPSEFGRRYAKGLNRGPVCPVLTSAGIGMSLIPMRLYVDPELVEITLVTASPPQPGRAVGE